MDPYRDSAAPPPVKKIIVKKWTVDPSALFLAGAICVGIIGLMKAYSELIAPQPCEEMVKIIASDNDDRHCRNGSRMSIERMNDQHVLVRCVCDASDAGAAR